MHRFALFLSVILTSLSVNAGMSYNFSSVTEGSGPASRMEGQAWIEGAGMRIDFKSGDGMLFKDGSVALSRDGGKTIFILDTKEKTYSELELEQILGLLGNLAGSTGGLIKLNFQNPKVTVKPAGAGEVIEGYPTKKYSTDTSYDLVVSVMGFKNETHVESHTDSWVTEKLGSELTTFVLMKGFRTGNEELDSLIDAQSKGINGLALRQIMSTTTTAKRGKPQSSKTTINVTGIEKVSVAAAKFEVPAGYKKSEVPLLDLEKLQQPRQRE